MEKINTPRLQSHYRGVKLAYVPALIQGLPPHLNIPLTYRLNKSKKRKYLEDYATDILIKYFSDVKSINTLANLKGAIVNGLIRSLNRVDEVSLVEYFNVEELAKNIYDQDETNIRLVNDLISFYEKLGYRSERDLDNWGNEGEVDEDEI